ncbi:hypothetical protein H5201_21110 [Pseudoalteromonas sp. SG43-6]|uniref:hypothetical protein n=1 Tax=Pseudoalteromonas sp. SG43-6 TaxID=2760967 RepID=UPI0015FEDEAC|nr:hypothetical protein [Pseudoalteromonas sp. SG43-6]MBB1436755.1 hypothetical protein [Pseudoalteromonas sp. SG43-6]
MDFIFQFIFFVIFFYAFFVIVKECKKLTRETLLFFVASLLLHSFFVFYFINDILIFNSNGSYSYGQDSDVFEGFLKVFSIDNLEYLQSEYNFINDNKGFYYLSVGFYFELFDIGGETWLFFIFNYVFFFASILLLNKNISQNASFAWFLLAFNPISFFIITTFLRESLLLLSIAFFYDFFGRSNRRFLDYILFSFFAIAIAQTRSIYLYSTLITIFVWYISFYRKDSIDKKSFIFKSSLLILAVLALAATFFNDFLTSNLVRLLVLNGSDTHHIAGYDGLSVDSEVLSQGDYSLVNIIFIISERAVLGLSKMMITPIAFDSFYYLLIGESVNYYENFAVRFLFFLGALIFNFIIFPMFISSILKVKFSKEFIKEFYLLFCYFTTVFVYSIKFMGQRNFKIDFINHIIMVAFCFKNGFEKDRPFWFAFYFMVLLNLIKGCSVMVVEI